MLTPHYEDESVVLYHGDCLDVLRQMPDASVDSVCTDPPYGIGFMGKEWDHKAIREAHERDKAARKNLGPDSASRPGRAAPRSSSAFGDAAIIAGPVTGGQPFQSWCEQWATECLRVLKPGGHMLAFGGSRTWHRLAAAVEDAGFEIRDSIAWLYAQGFPKSLDVSKAIDKAAGVDREVIRQVKRTGKAAGTYGAMAGDNLETAPATPDAARWQGWGTSLKPAFEPVVVGRKPLAGTTAANVLAHGTGALNIDGCRVAMDDADPRKEWQAKYGGRTYADYGENEWQGPGLSQTSAGSPLGRWPTNVVLDAHAAAELDAQSGTLTSGQPGVHRKGRNDGAAYGAESRQPGTPMSGHGDSGGASRFFPVVNTTSEERARGFFDSTPEFEGTVDDAFAASDRHIAESFHYEAKAPTAERPRAGDTGHPTVKPLDLMRWLVRLVTPPGGTVLEPFAGSGTTAEACVIEGFHCIAIEREADYLPLIVARLTKPIQPDMFGGVA